MFQFCGAFSNVKVCRTLWRYQWNPEGETLLQLNLSLVQKINLISLIPITVSVLQNSMQRTSTKSNVIGFYYTSAIKTPFRSFSFLDFSLQRNLMLRPALKFQYFGNISQIKQSAMQINNVLIENDNANMQNTKPGGAKIY